MSMELSAKELMYAAALSEAKYIWGISDPFLGESPEDVNRQIKELQKSLVAKGYASEGFEESFQLNKECRELVSSCCDCEQLFGLEIQQSSVEPKQLFCYRKGEELTLLQGEEKQLTLERVNGEGIPEKCREMLTSEEGDVRNPVEGMVTVKLIEEAKATGNREQAERLLAENGVCKEIAEVIGATIIGRVRTIRIYLQDTKARTREDLLLLWTEKGILEITEDIQQAEETWRLRSMEGDEILQMIAEKCNRLIQKAEVQS